MPPFPIPDFPALLTVLDDRGIRLGLDEQGRVRRVRLDAPTGSLGAEIRMQVRRYRALLAATVTARGTGHRWAPCSVCGEVMLIAHDRETGNKPGRPCAMTPGCAGYHRHTEGATP